MSTSTAAQLSNRILAGLPAPDREAVFSVATRVPLEFGANIYREGEPIREVYFPDRGVISMVNTMADGTTIEVGTIGREGAAGLGLFLGVSSVTGHTFVQVAGDGWKIDEAPFRDLLQKRGALSARLGRYTQGLFTQVAQSAACNRAHPVEQRCARWLLMTHDRVDGDEFPLTQEFLAQMLGVRRAGVSEAASALQRTGCISYTRGSIRILDRARLETASCECHLVVQREFDRLLAPAP
jgi:CRP-like cAMP-binding protein